MDVTIDCPCEGKPHEQDTVTLRAGLGFHELRTIKAAIDLAIYETGHLVGAEALAVLSEWYVLLGITEWTLVDDKGEPIPVTRSAIEREILGRWEIASVIADAADGLYSETVTVPFLDRMTRAPTEPSSPPTPTDASTSPTKGSSGTPPTPLKRSSTTTSRTDATATTSPLPAGASNSSQSSASAA